MMEKSPMQKFKKYIVVAIITVTAYVCLIAFPLQYLQLPGYRQIGTPLEGGWRWGGAFGCFDDVPVLFFEGRTGYLVREGEVIWKLFENINLDAKDGLLKLTGSIYPFDVRNPTDVGRRPGAGARGDGKPHPVAINYLDRGKILIVREMHLDGVQMRDRVKTKSHILAQCGYPGLTLFLLRTLGIKKYWRKPPE